MESTYGRIWLNRLISGIFVLFVGMLSALSIFLHCETNIYDYGHAKAVVAHTPYLYGGLAIVGVCVMGLVCALLEYMFAHAHKAEKIGKGIFWFCGAVILTEGVIWIFFNDCVPVNDQVDVYQGALWIAGLREGAFDPTGYFSIFHRNRGITLLAAAALKIFGNHLYSFRLMNLCAAVLVYYSICRASGLIFRNRVVTAVTSLLLMAFYPIVIYTAFLYGTLLSAAFASLGLYAALALRETGRIRYGVVIILAFPFGILMHQSAAIGLTAAVIYLVVSTRGRAMLKNILICGLAVMMVFFSSKVTDTVFGHLTGTDLSKDSIPVFCTVYMGLTSTDEAGGPGSQDGSYSEIFMENGQDGKAAGRDAAGRIYRVLGEYLSGERSLAFLLEKTEYQWLDPTFGARKTINLNDTAIGEVPNSDAFTAFYHSPLREMMFQLSVGFLLLVYMCAFIAGIKIIREGKACPNAVLPFLYVIGGGAFQTFWESLSRYCFGYFLWLLPVAAFGIHALYRICRECGISGELPVSDIAA